MNRTTINILFAVFTGILLMNSCLGEGNNVVEYGAQPGVASVETEETFIYITNGQKVLPSGSSISLGNNEPLLMNYKVDLDDVGGDSYFPVELTSQPMILKKYDLVGFVDTTEVMDLEKTINTFNRNYAFIRNQLFLYMGFTIADSMTIHNVYNMCYLEDQVAKLDTTVKANVYELYLRVQKDENTTGSRTADKSKTEIVTFAIDPFVSQFKEKELAKDSANMYIRIKYAKSFNSDTTIINWGESSAFAIPISR